MITFYICNYSFIPSWHQGEDDIFLNKLLRRKFGKIRCERGEKGKKFNFVGKCPEK